jgi:hypothetical protein
MSCFKACKRTQKWRGSRHFRQNFSPIFPPSAAGFASVASDAGGLLWRKFERSKSLVLLQLGGLTCRWQRHFVKPSYWKCSTTVEQAETQLRVVVPIEEEEYKKCVFCWFSLHKNCLIILVLSPFWRWSNVSRSVGGCMYQCARRHMQKYVNIHQRLYEKFNYTHVKDLTDFRPCIMVYNIDFTTNLMHNFF